MLGAGLILAACGDDQRERERERVAEISGEGQRLVLDRRVVDQLMADEGLDEAAARERGLDILRLVAARRAELDAREQPPEHPDELDPERRRQLERAALSSLWLDEHFEPEHDADDIPPRVIDANMADPSLTRRLFHPKLWFVCQALVVPAETNDDGRHVEPPGEAEAAARWQAEAEAALAPLLARVERFRDDLLSDQNCELFGRMVGTSAHQFETASGEDLVLRYERFAFAPSEAASFDPAWVEIVSAHDQPTIIEPFATRFGLHLVIVGKVEDAALAEGSLPPAELDAARRARLREEIETAWRGQSLAETLTELREHHVVRLAPERDE